jgi:cytochrome c oxidase cbb3-type subunit 4
MDINTLRSISPILVLLAFIGVCWWAFAPKRRKRFEEAAKLPFADEEQPQSDVKKTTTTKQEQDKL